MNPLVAFVDGSIAPSRDVGGVCVVTWRFDEKSSGRHISWFSIDGILYKDSFIKITNNTMELSAVHAACKILHPVAQPGQRILVWTDSQYAKGCLSAGSGWEPKENTDLIKEYRKITTLPEVEIYWVRGHAGVAWNEVVNLGAQKVVECRKGFSGGRNVHVSLDCAGCEYFACKDPEFGKKTSVLTGVYDAPCNKYIRWGPGLLEAARSERVDRPAGRVTKYRSANSSRQQPGEESGTRPVERPGDPPTDCHP